MNEAKHRHVCSIKQGDVLIVEITTPELHGDIVESELRDELLSTWYDSAAKHVVIDFAAVRYLTSPILRALIALQRAVKADSGRALLCNVHNRDVLDILKTTRLVTTSGSLPYLFELVPDLATALAHLQGPHPQSDLTETPARDQANNLSGQ